MEELELVGREALARYDDARLVAGLQRELSRQCMRTARVVAFIAEVDARRLYREHAYASMFDYAVKALHMSEGEAYPRIYAGRLGRKYPLVLEMLARGEVHLSAIRIVGAILTEDNHREVLAAIALKSKRDVERWLATRDPKPDVNSSLRKLPELVSGGNHRCDGDALGLEFENAEDRSAERALGAARPGESPGSEAYFLAAPPNGCVGSVPESETSARGGAPSSAAQPRSVAGVSPVPGAVMGELARSGSQQRAVVVAARGDLPCAVEESKGRDRSPRSVASSKGAADVTEPETMRKTPIVAEHRRPAEVKPLGSSRYKVQFTATQQLHDKLQQARHLLRHQIPDGDVAKICERALDLLIAQRMKERFATGVMPRRKKPSAQKGESVRSREGIHVSRARCGRANGRLG